jgi:hypothetical protein
MFIGYLLPVFRVAALPVSTPFEMIGELAPFFRGMPNVVGGTVHEQMTAGTARTTITASAIVVH